jgi:hypothetical protein
MLHLDCRGDEVSPEAALPASTASGEAREEAAAPVKKVESRRKAATKRVVVWFLFGAFFGLWPLFAVMIKEAFSPTGFNIDQLLNNGDLFTISAVLAAGALGELIAAASKGGMSFFLVIFSGFFCLMSFAGDLVAFYASAGSTSSGDIAIASLCCFPLTLVASGLCIGVAAYS